MPDRESTVEQRPSSFTPVRRGARRVGPSAPGPKNADDSDFDLVHIAPAPVFAGLERLDDGMFRGMKMFGGVLVLRAVAAADVAADQAKSQMDPRIADLQAILAAVRAGLHFANFVHVLAGGHKPLDSGGACWV